MPGRHLRRPPGWWLRRALVVALVLAIGAVIGAGGWILLEGDDEPVAAGDGTATLEPAGGPLTVALAGEVAPGWALAAELAGPPLTDGLLDVLGDAEVAVVDLSAAVVDEEPVAADGAAWVGSEVLDALEEAGVDVVSLANDRSLDLGADGRDRTLGARAGRRLDVVGIGADEDEAYAPSVRQVGSTSVAVIAATQELAPERIASDTAAAGTPGVASAKRVDRLVTAVEAASVDADVVVVYLHWGEPGQTCPSAGQQELASALVAAGADVVAGTGAGVVQGAGRLDGAVVAYGLGALVVDGATEGAALVVEVDDGDLAAWDLVPATVVDGVAQPVGDPAEGVDLAERQACAGLTP